MAEQTGTPTRGPWAVTTFGAAGFEIQAAASQVALVRPTADRARDQASADARLIAAAPLLLDAAHAGNVVLGLLSAHPAISESEATLQVIRDALETIWGAIHAAGDGAVLEAAFGAGEGGEVVPA